MEMISVLCFTSSKKRMVGLESMYLKDAPEMPIDVQLFGSLHSDNNWAFPRTILACDCIVNRWGVIVANRGDVLPPKIIKNMNIEFHDYIPKQEVANAVYAYLKFGEVPCRE